MHEVMVLEQKLRAWVLIHSLEVEKDNWEWAELLKVKLTPLPTRPHTS